MMFASVIGQAATDVPWVNYHSPLTQNTLDTHSNQLIVQFIGAGGSFLSYNHHGLLVDPFYTNPGLMQLILLNKLEPNHQIIDAHLPPTTGLTGVLVGHSHYDHLLDVPYILSRLPKSSKVYGNLTMTLMFSSHPQPSRWINWLPFAAGPNSNGSWQYLGKTIKVLPILSEHSPHIAGKVFAKGPVLEPRADFPEDALDWKAGQPLSFVIDFLDDKGNTQFRVFYQSSTSSAPIGFPPASVVNDGTPFNLACIATIGHDKVKDYPEKLLDHIHPRQISLLHWESFWEPYQPGQAAPISQQALEDMLAKIKKSHPEIPVLVPQRGAWFTLPPEAR